MAVASAKITDFLNKGMFTVPEAAMYARVTPQMIRRWFWDGKRSKSAFKPELNYEDKLITFVDFVQCLTAREVRLQWGLSLQKIRDAVDVLDIRHGIQFPFAREHRLYVFEGEIVYFSVKHDGFFFVSGREAHQQLHPIVQEHLKNISFNADGIACSYEIDRIDEIPIVMNARRRFGEPTMPSGYTAQALWDAVRIEGGYEQAAKVSGVDEREIRAAFSFYNRIQQVN